MKVNGLNTKFSSAVRNTFSNSSASNPLLGMSHGKSLKHGRGGVQVTTKNPFQGAINKSALSVRRY